ncbi:MAG: hypothetical protein E7617_06015 [Ruminococcaceae bacterium]|nr:hypothetical protein [Oscillospiraceae bacterium]
MKKKIIIDTDIGDDIDDAFALLTAMEGNADIIGITTVFGNTEERARIAKKLLRLYGRGYENVPVFAGHGIPLAEEKQNTEHLCQYTEDVDCPEYAPDSSDANDAVDFIINSAKTYGKDLTIIAIGPFTNIAQVIIKDKKALELAGEIIIMGGAYYRQYVDWNVLCDTEAAELMFDSLENVRCLGADVTHRLKLTDADDAVIDGYIGTRQELKYLSSLYKLWKKWSGGIGVLHDPLAVLCAFDSSYVKCESVPVKVIASGYARGITLNVKAYGKASYNPEFRSFDMSKTHTVAYEVDRERVISDFISYFK